MLLLSWGGLHTLRQLDVFYKHDTLRAYMQTFRAACVPPLHLLLKDLFMLDESFSIACKREREGRAKKGVEGHAPQEEGKTETNNEEEGETVNMMINFCNRLDLVCTLSPPSTHTALQPRTPPSNAGTPSQGHWQLPADL